MRSTRSLASNLNHVDTSKRRAILRREPDAQRYWQVVLTELDLVISVAALNFSDHFGYELASHFECPLLYIGSDLARTDVVVAVLGSC